MGIIDLPYLLNRIVKKSSLYFPYFVSRRVQEALTYNVNF